MKKYRIKIVTFKNGRQEFTPAVKIYGIWMGLDYEGGLSVISFEQDTREQALSRIDKHRAGNATVHSIEFEYIDE